MILIRVQLQKSAIDPAGGGGGVTSVFRGGGGGVHTLVIKI